MTSKRLWRLGLIGVLLSPMTTPLPAKEKVVFVGPFKDKRLTLERTDDKTKEDQRLVVSLLHDNRYLYKYEAKPAEKPTYKAVYQVGATKEGVPFATTDFVNECVVSGGKGTMPVTYMGTLMCTELASVAQGPFLLSAKM